MNSNSPLVRLWRWAATHRRTWLVISGLVWAGLIWLIMRNLLIAVVCGAAFGAIFAFSLPHPPTPTRPKQH
ncbi:MAG: hypothetical protein WCA46_29285 [Actinocatenispora sp.]